MSVPKEILQLVVVFFIISLLLIPLIIFIISPYLSKLRDCKKITNAKGVVFPI